MVSRTTFTGVRSVRHWNAVLTNSLDTTGVIEVADGGNTRIYFPASSTSTLGTIYDLDPETGNYVPAKNYDGTPFTLTLAASTAESVNYPVNLFAAYRIKIVLNAAETVTVGLVTKT